MEWKSWFDKKILDRGREYFNSDLVDDFEVDTDKITALVIGNDEYDVSIELRNGELEYMDCTCPYADEGFYCKHMAAVLYAYEALSLSAKKAAKVPKPSAEELVGNADEKTVREFLIKTLNSDKKLLDSFRLAVSSSSADIDISAYKKRSDSIVRKHTDRYDYVDYYSAGDFIDDVVGFLYDDINGLIEKGYISEAFEVSCYHFKAVSDVDMDDSDGGLSVFGSDMLDTWSMIIDKATEAERKQMFKWFMAHIDGWVIDYMEDYIEEILFNAFDDTDHLKSKLGFVDEMISASDDWCKKHWIVRRIELMEQLDYPEVEFVTYCKKYYDDSYVRSALVNYYLNKDRKANAIAIIEDSLANYATNPLVAEKLHCQLKDLYKEVNNDDEYRKQLWLLVTNYCKLDYFQELRTLYPDEEWTSIRGKIFRSNSGYALMQLYNEEGLYDLLMTELEKSGSPTVGREFEDVLNELYPERMLMLYANYLNHEATEAAKRSTYAYWANELCHMLTIKGGSEVVKYILADWRKRYKNRPAMMQELNRVKI